MNRGKRFSPFGAPEKPKSAKRRRRRQRKLEAARIVASDRRKAPSFVVERRGRKSRLGAKSGGRGEGGEPSARQ